ncbi:MAG TPA: HAMP domain-containing sensor histidine kinase [Solirubrobacter sp.]|nr:HAMP domain-containing sensor histidine kinase [Solirubrobacter sp.]
MRRPGLRARLVLTLFGTAAATLLVAALALLPPLEHRLSTDAARALTLRAEAARPGFERLPPGASPRHELRELARAADARVVLLGPDGAVTGDATPTALARRVLATRRGENAVDGDVAQAAIPLHIADQPAALALTRRLGDVGRTYAVVVNAFAGAALAALALALVGGIALSGRMLRRLRALSDAMRAADPLLEPSEVDPARDELGELARAFAGLQQRIAQQEDARRMFVATASHELRTPLAILHSLLELTVDESDPELVRADVAEALTQTERLTALSTGLLDLSRLDAGVALRSEPIELGELSRAVAAEFGDDGRPRWVAPAAACWARGDPEGVARIVRLLIDNALRYAPPPAPVEVRTDTCDGHAEVRVLDGGNGVPESERAAIFERFHRGAQPGVPGFGLGLAIGAELARRMAGELRLEPDAPLGGAHFVLILPHA